MRHNTFEGDLVEDVASESVASEPISSGEAVSKAIRNILDYPTDGADGVSDTDLIDDNEELKTAQQRKFDEDTNILNIPSIDYRYICYHLGVSDVGHINNASHKAQPLICMMLMQNIPEFMEAKGYQLVGEKNFTRDGAIVSTHKTTWNLKGQEIGFVDTGFLYFEKIGSNDKHQNIVLYNFYSAAETGAGMTAYATSKKISQRLLHELDEYTKIRNAFRGAFIKDIGIAAATFSEIAVKESHNWDNYYYEQSVIDLFQLEVFGFMQNIEKYNNSNINKRGLILHGKPGCVIKGTKIKVRKKSNEGKHKIITD